jgi:predicted PurR-regulated permease PerM
VFASFLGFPANACHKMVKKIGFSNFWAPLLGTLSFLFLLICLFAALSASLARLEPDFPRYLDHIQERLTPILQAVQRSSPSIDRLDGWLNPGKNPQVSIRGPSFVEITMKNAPRFFAILIIVHVLAFFLLLYGARLLKKLVEHDSGVVREAKRHRNRGRDRANRSALFYFGDAHQCCFGIECLDPRGFAGAAHPLLWGVAFFLLNYIPFVGATGGILAMDARFADSF